jgi:hypothetical protein
VVRLRRLLTLLYHLPADSEFLEDVDLGVKARWDVKTELLATIAELLDLNTRKGTKRKQPLITIKRPWKKTKAKPVSMQSPEARQFFGGSVHYEPKAGPEPKALGGGWFELPDGSKVQGRAKAIERLKAQPETS